MIENSKATVNIHDALHLFDKIKSLLFRECKGHCSLKRQLEEYAALRFGVFWFEHEYGVGFDDDAKLVAVFEEIIKQLDKSRAR